MSSVCMIGMDLAKNVFQVHGGDQFGAVFLRKKLRREGVVAYLAKQPACLVAMASLCWQPLSERRNPVRGAFLHSICRFLS